MSGVFGRFDFDSVDFIDVEGRELSSSSIMPFIIMTLSYFLHWYEFDLEQRPLPVLVESDDSEAFALEMPEFLFGSRRKSDELENDYALASARSLRIRSVFP
jgi:hypothetical protein